MLGIYSEETARKIDDFVNQMIRSGYALPWAKTDTAPQVQPRPILFRNVSGSTIPPYSYIQTTDTVEIGPQNYIEVDQYDDSIFGVGLFSWHEEVLDDEFGIAQPGPHYMVQGDGSTVTAGELWGPVEADWTFTDNGGPYIAIGEDDIADDVLWVRADPQNVYIAEVTTEVTARSGSTLGSGVVKLQPIGNGWTIADSQTGIDVGSILSGTIAVGATVGLSRAENGKLVVTFEDCG